MDNKDYASLYGITMCTFSLLTNHPGSMHISLFSLPYLYSQHQPDPLHFSYCKQYSYWELFTSRLGHNSLLNVIVSCIISSSALHRKMRVDCHKHLLLELRN